MEKPPEPISVEQMNLNPEVYKRVIFAKVFIDENYQDRIGLEEISEKAFFSPFHFHRLFKHIYRRTPHQYITQRRLNKAKDLLRENKPVMEVCNEVGFESIGSFSVLFKKEIGFAPQYYRNKAWLKKQKQKKQPGMVIPHCFIEQYNLK